MSKCRPCGAERACDRQHDGPLGRLDQDKPTCFKDSTFHVFNAKPQQILDTVDQHMIQNTDHFHNHMSLFRINISAVGCTEKSKHL